MWEQEPGEGPQNCSAPFSNYSPTAPWQVTGSEWLWGQMLVQRGAYNRRPEAPYLLLAQLLGASGLGSGTCVLQSSVRQAGLGASS